MIVHKGKFVKKNGSERVMTFCRLKDMPSDFVASKILGTGQPRKLKEDSELVWDLEEDGFRIFNWGTLVGNIEEFDIPDKYLW